MINATTYGRVVDKDGSDPMADDHGMMRHPERGQAVTPTLLSEVLRNGVGPELTRRRWSFGLSLVGTVAAQVVGLYQMGIIRKLPSLPLPILDATRVDAAGFAYKGGQTPDAALMLISYSVTAALAAAGPRDRAKRTPWLPIILALKAGTDLAVAIRLSIGEYRATGKLSDYCQLSALASAATAALSIPEAIEAVGELRGQGQTAIA